MSLLNRSLTSAQAAKIKEDLTINASNSPNSNTSNSSTRKPWVFAAVIVSILVFIGLLVALTPKGFDSNLNQLGSGKPAVVFVYDPNLVVSGQQMQQMNMARDQLQGPTLFVVAKIGSPEGDRFIATHNAKPAELILFNPEGVPVKRAFALKQSNQLIAWLELQAP